MKTCNAIDRLKITENKSSESKVYTPNVRLIRAICTIAKTQSSKPASPLHYRRQDAWSESASQLHYNCQDAGLKGRISASL